MAKQSLTQRDLREMPAYGIAEPRDSAFYSILASEWPGVRDRLTEALEGIPGGGTAAR